MNVKPNRAEPRPITNESRPIWELVVGDMKERDRIGRNKYGTPLQAHNGRDALVDAYQEALDLAVYLRQLIEERERSQIDDDLMYRLRIMRTGASPEVDDLLDIIERIREIEIKELRS